MPNLAQVQLMGHVTADGQLSELASGTPVLEFSLAINYKRAGYQDVTFIKIQKMGKFAPMVADQVTKGALVMVTGRLKENRWKAQDGTNRSQHVVMADQIHPVQGGEKPAQYDSESFDTEDLPF